MQKIYSQFFYNGDQAEHSPISASVALPMALYKYVYDYDYD